MDFEQNSISALDKKDTLKYAKYVFDSLTEKERAAILFDVPYDQRRKIFIDCIKKSPCVLLGSHRGRPFCVFWTVPTYRGARTAAIHFICHKGDKEQLLELAEICFEECAELYDNLIAIIPAKYYGLRKFMEQIGFKNPIKMKKACRIDLHDRLVDGLFYCLDLQRGKDAKKNKGLSRQNARLP